MNFQCSVGGGGTPHPEDMNVAQPKLAFKTGTESKLVRVYIPKLLG